MNNWASLLTSIIRDEQGSEIVEYSIVVALVVVRVPGGDGKVRREDHRALELD